MKVFYAALTAFAIWRAKRNDARADWWADKAKEWDRLAHPESLTTGEE